MTFLEEMAVLSVKVRRRIRETENGCWEWVGAKSSGGYGQVWWSDRKRTVLTHRVMAECAYGPIPDKMQVDHLCRNRACCNPAHLEIVTPSENTRRGVGPSIARTIGQSKTHCKHGHPYDQRSTYVAKTGRRQCKVCHLIRTARIRAELRGNGLTQAGKPRQRRIAHNALTAKELEHRYEA